MAAQHTPGPWRQGKNANLWIYSEQRLIVKVCPDSTSSGANARLIAAAPDLLEALKAALPNLEWANIHGSRCEEILSQVKIAIQKAEGR